MVRNVYLVQSLHFVEHMERETVEKERLLDLLRVRSDFITSISIDRKCTALFHDSVKQNGADAINARVKTYEGFEYVDVLQSLDESSQAFYDRGKWMPLEFDAIARQVFCTRAVGHPMEVKVTEIHEHLSDDFIDHCEYYWDEVAKEDPVKSDVTLRELSMPYRDWVVHEQLKKEAEDENILFMGSAHPLQRLHEDPDFHVYGIQVTYDAEEQLFRVTGTLPKEAAGYAQHFMPKQAWVRCQVDITER